MASFWLGVIFCLSVVLVVVPLFSNHTWQIEDEPLKHIDRYVE
jgi:hypothetical protein